MRGLRAAWPALERLPLEQARRSGRSPPGTVLLFESELNPRRGPWDTPRLHELGDAVDVWARWDSNWYLLIAESGYDWPSSTPAFFPLYPLLVGGLGRLLGGHFLLAGLVVSLVACAAAFALLYGLIERRLGRGDARRTVLYLALFPTSFFLGAVYGESLFLALAVGVFVLAERGRLGWAAVLAGLALLTRAQGVALLPALAFFAWRSPRRSRSLGLLAVPIAMFLAFPLALEAWIGHGLAFLDAQRLWERSVAVLGPLGGLVQAIGEGDVVGPVLAVAMLALAVLAWRLLGPAYGSYAGSPSRSRWHSPPSGSAGSTRSRASRSSPSRASPRWPCSAATAACTSPSSSFSPLLSPSTWFDGRCGTGSPDGGPARSPARLGDPRRRARAPLVRVPARG